MEERVVRQVSERDLRALSTADLLSLIHEDIRELDHLLGVRRQAEHTKRAARRKTAGEALEALPPDEIPVPFHAVTCCNHYMGDFLPSARVRCPFCSEWHRAGDFPSAC